MVLRVLRALLWPLFVGIERRRVRRAMYQALPQGRDDISDPLRLGGETRSVSVLFCRVVNLNLLARPLMATPDRAVALLDRCLTPLTDVVLNHGGRVDSIMGDLVMALWNAPFPVEDHARRAMLAALDMCAAVEQLNGELALGETRLVASIGLNSGEAVVGNMGSRQRFNYTAIGDPVNLAEELAQIAQRYGVPMVIGEDTRAQAPEYATLELDLALLPGRRQPVQLHALIGDAAVRHSRDFQTLAAAHQRMLAAYRSQYWDRALVFIGDARAADRWSLGALYDQYAARIASLRERAPPEAWDGTHAWPRIARPARGSYR